ncbi:MAG: ABC transporter ATP-binding protein [Phycisphaerales bacterium]|nr:MAG: ABC transporter ATP-binding protein [Phycisphaerales bacterium]
MDADSSQPVVCVRGLAKRFGDIQALAGIDFDVPAARIVGLLGPNGAGKSTTLHCMLGVIEPDAGTIELRGRSLATHRQHILAEIGFGSASVSLPQNLTVNENLITFGRLYGVRDIRARIAELLEMVELPDVGDRVLSRLSTGQIIRINLTKALIHRPSVLLLDEPTASLDPDIADKVRTLIRRIQRHEGVTVLYTSHNMYEVEQLCDRVIFLNRGRIIARGSPQEILQQFGSESMESFFVQVARGGELIGRQEEDA